MVSDLKLGVIYNLSKSLDYLPVFFCKVAFVLALGLSFTDFSDPVLIFLGLPTFFLNFVLKILTSRSACSPEASPSSMFL